MPRAAQRTPGISFETRTPPARDTLPRLDVTAFVGFAAAGPLDVPVPVEDAAHFEELFGTDQRLAWDVERGEWTYAELAPAVRSFFRAGGRRCWVVRVADRATVVTNRFTIPRVLSADPGGIPTAAAAFARSPGSWSDGLSVNATVVVRPLPPPTPAPITSPPSTNAFAAGGVAAGDLVRFDYPEEGVTGFLAAVSRRDLPRAPVVLEPPASGSWFVRLTSELLSTTATAAADRVRALGTVPDARWLTGPAPDDDVRALVDPSLSVDRWGWRERDDRTEELVIELAADDRAPVRPGTWVRLDLAPSLVTGAVVPPLARAAFALVDRVEDMRSDAVARTAGRRLVATQAWWLMDATGVAEWVGDAVPRRAIVELELLVHEGDRLASRAVGIGCAPGHSRYWGDAVDDATLYLARGPEQPWRAEEQGRAEPRALRDGVDGKRFPLAAPTGGESRLLPLAVLAWPRREDFQSALLHEESALQRDGLNAFSVSLFLDDEVGDASAERLLAEAFQVQYVLTAPGGGTGRALRGMHALLPNEEVAVIAVPDAMQRPWTPDVRLNDDGRAPSLGPVETVPDGGGLRLRWNGARANVTYEAEVSADPRFAAGASRATLAGTPGPGSLPDEMSLVDPADDILARRPTTRAVACPPQSCDTGAFYRVRARTAGAAEPWSETRAARFPSAAFTPVDRPSLEAPVLTMAATTDRTRLEWTVPVGAPAGARVTYTLEQSEDPTFATPAVVHQGEERDAEVWRAAGRRTYYRVTADVDGRAAPWSATRGTDDEAGSATARPSVVSAREYEEHLGNLERVHLALLRLCAARGDVHAVLGLPAHFDASAARGHVGRLAAAIETTGGDDRLLTFGAVFHPWPVVRETAGAAPFATWAVAPEGTICGVLAARALRDGPWYSPAHRVLPGVVSLVPRLAGDGRELLDARINALASGPRGIVALDELTLVADPELDALHVRRLMMLLRRLAVREGTQLAFQTNAAALRRQAERLFERYLGELHERGALAGATADEAYRVVAGEALNTRQSVDQGRLLVELRVAPSYPLQFLSVRLVQAGSDLLAAEEA